MHGRLSKRLRRPNVADVGLVGKSKGKYTVFLGGRVLGDRLNYLYKDNVPAKKIVSTLVPIFEQFKAERQDDERFGDYCWRKKDALLATTKKKK